MNRRVAIVVLGAVLAGCAAGLPPSPLFVEVEPFEPPTRDTAQIVFLAPRAAPTAANANALYELHANQRTLLAALAGHTGSFQQVPPGHHVFMAVGRAAHLLEADVEGGARYYVLLRPDASGDLTPLPVRMSEDAEISNRSSESGQWLFDSTLVAKTAAADAWFAAKASQVDAAQAAALAVWQRQSAAQHAAATLGKDDAVLR